tara:strand:+ start:27593 stop:28483 length:891 start_codon:yes stop_codon:yes gene_type:complete
MKFKLVFNDTANNEFELIYKVYSNSTAVRWFTALVEQCNKDNCILEKDRFYNFPDNNWTEEIIVRELNNCIEIINNKKPVIFHTAYVGMPQEQLNHLHHYFEDLRGGILTPTDFWSNATKQEQESLERYNVIIHRAENFYSNAAHRFFNPRIVCRFNNRTRYDMIDEDYQYFTLVRKFGEVYINYCEVGKPLYDVYKDGDNIVGEDNIRPLKYYSSDFTVYFHNRSNERVNIFLEGMNRWWDSNNNYLTALGFTKDDPKNAIGNIPVAMIETSLSREEVVDKLCKYNSMSRVEILN